MAAAVQINRLDLSVFRSAIKITRGHGVNGNDVTTVCSRDDSLVVLLMGGLPVQPPSLMRWAAPLGREYLRDAIRHGGRVGERNVRHYGDDYAVLRECHQGSYPPARRVAIVADYTGLFARQRCGPDVPAKAVTCITARRQRL